jgi:hypothetical protein
MSNKSNSFKSKDRTVGNYIFHWEKSPCNGHFYLKIMTVSGGWQLRIRDDMECVPLWRNLLLEGDCEKELNVWLDTMALVNTTIGDSVFASLVGFARQTFVIRHMVRTNKDKSEEDKTKEKDITEKLIDDIQKYWDSYVSLVRKDITKEDDDRITEEQRKIHIGMDMDKQESGDKE